MAVLSDKITVSVMRFILWQPKIGISNIKMERVKDYSVLWVKPKQYSIPTKLLYAACQQQRRWTV